MKKIIKFSFTFKNIVIENDLAQRLDVFLKNTSNFNWGQIQNILKKKQIKVETQNKLTSAHNYILKQNDTLIIPLNYYNENFNLKKIKIQKEKNLKLIKNDEYTKSLYEKIILEKKKNYLVINKPIGLLSQGTNIIEDNLYVIIKSYLKLNNMTPTLHIVHRLDKPVSGILIMALNKKFAQKISELIKEHKVKKIYNAIVQNIPFDFLERREQFEIECFMKFNKNTSRAVIVDNRTNNTIKATKTKITIKNIFGLKKDFTRKIKINLSEQGSNYVMDFYEKNKLDYFFYTEIEYDLISGKRHQLRALSKDVLKCPILLDKKYSGKSENDSIENIIHKKLISNDFIHSTDTIVNDYFKKIYQQKDYIYLHSKSLLIDDFEEMEDIKKSEIVNKGVEKEDNENELKKSNVENQYKDKIEYKADFPTHFKIFNSFFE